MIIGALICYKLPLAPYVQYHEELLHHYNNFFVGAIMSLIISALIYTLSGYTL